MSETIPEDIVEAGAAGMYGSKWSSPKMEERPGEKMKDVWRRYARDCLRAALPLERERWKPAVTYFERYCLDEADSAEDCVCGDAQHQDAKAFEAVVRGSK